MYENNGLQDCISNSSNFFLIKNITCFLKRLDLHNRADNMYTKVLKLFFFIKNCLFLKKLQIYILLF